jgi:uncharacterized membrane protein
LSRYDAVNETPSAWTRVAHTGALLFVAYFCSHELAMQTKHLIKGSHVWQLTAAGLAPLILAIGVYYNRASKRWPFSIHSEDYTVFGLGLVMLCNWLWVLYTNWHSTGYASPLSYVPILNPLEIYHALFMVALPLALIAVHKKRPMPRWVMISGVLGTYFIWLNGVLMRAIHHIANVPFYFHSLMSSALVQASLSIYWSVIGISFMIVASKKKLRSVWVIGAGLMGLVVVKLFMFDLAQSDTIERIVSFISVGVILLVVGYFSPLPPKIEERN